MRGLIGVLHRGLAQRRHKACDRDCRRSSYGASVRCGFRRPPIQAAGTRQPSFTTPNPRSPFGHRVASLCARGRPPRSGLQAGVPVDPSSLPCPGARRSTSLLDVSRSASSSRGPRGGKPSTRTSKPVVRERTRRYFGCSRSLHGGTFGSSRDLRQGYRRTTGSRAEAATARSPLRACPRHRKDWFATRIARETRGAHS